MARELPWRPFPLISFQQNHNKPVAFDAPSLSIVGLSKNNEISIFRDVYLPKVMTTGNDQATSSGLELNRVDLNRV